STTRSPSSPERRTRTSSGRWSRSRASWRSSGSARSASRPPSPTCSDRPATTRPAPPTGHRPASVTWSSVCVASATLVVWSSAWLAGRAASDDVLDAMQVWAARHELEVADHQAADITGLPATRTSSPAGLLPVLRTFGSPPALVLPAPGDPRGLDAGGPFTKEALRAGEAVVLADAGIGLVPQATAEDVMRWRVH